MQGVLCHFCKSQTNKVLKTEAIKIDGKNFHQKCAKQYQDKKELMENICRIFNFKAPGPKNMAYISKFYNQGMTFKGMTNTLIYFYDIKKNDISKSNDGIGIIPYVYEEARNYYKNEEMKRQKQKKIIETIKNETQETRKVKVQKIERKPLVTPIPMINYFEEN